MLGERLQYVLLPGERLQDEAAEDPLTAALDFRTADSELYWKNKLQRPLQEVFATCLSPSALQVLIRRLHHKTMAEFCVRICKLLLLLCIVLHSADLLRTLEKVRMLITGLGYTKRRKQ